MTTPNSRADIVRCYFVALTASDIPAIVALFADDGYVVSPYWERCPPTISTKRSTKRQHKTS